MTFPPLVVSGQIISAAHTNALRNAIIAANAETYAWTRNVSAGGHNLSNVAAISGGSATLTGAATAASVSVTGGLAEIAGGTPILYMRETDAASGERLWKQYVSGTDLIFGVANDADSVESRWMQVFRVAGVATGVVFPAHVSVGFGVAPSAPVHVYRAGNDEQFRFSNDATYYGSLGRRASDGRIVLTTNQAAPASGWVVSLAGAEQSILTPSRVYHRPGTRPQYADNAAAIAGGLVAGDEYLVSSSNPRLIATVF